MSHISESQDAQSVSAQLDAACQNHVGASIPYEVMSSVPLGIGALGQLMLAASSVQDISINYPPENGFLFIQYPKSLRTTLIQISNCGYKAFGTADLGMGRIINCSRQISCSITEAGKMMKNSYSHADTTDNRKFLNEYVELRLTRVKEAAKLCQDESQKVVDQFSKLLQFIQEVLEASSNSKTVEERQLKKTKNLKDELEIKKKDAESEKLKLEEEEERRKIRLKETEEELKKTLGEVPKGLELLGFEALGLIKDGIKGVWNGIKGGLKKVGEKLNLSTPTDKEKEQRELTAIDLVKIKMEMTRQINLEAERKLEQAIEDRERHRREFTDLLIQLNGCDLTKVSYATAINMLQQGITFVGELLKHWRNFEQLFIKLNEHIKNASVPAITQFDKDLLLLQTHSNASLALQNDSLYKQVVEISQNSYVISCVAKLYIDISGKYIMPAIGGLNTMAAVESEKIQEKQALLKESAERAEDAINAAIQEKKNELLNKVEKNKQELERLFSISDDNSIEQPLV